MNAHEMKPVTQITRERWTRELLRAMERAESLKTDKAQVVKDFAGKIAEAEIAVKHWRNLLEGKSGEQLPLEVEADE